MTEATPVEGQDEEVPERREKRRKPGIIYLSSIPPSMNVAKIREYFGQFGDIDRVFLQPSNKEDTMNGSKGSTKGKRNKKTLHYSEGWVEFKSKRKAKKVHLFLNNQPVGGKKKNPYYDVLWNIKYLPRFKWAFLKQRLEYEREVYRQRMGAEISQVRRETDHFIKVSDISEKKEKRRKKMMKEAEKRAKETQGDGPENLDKRKTDENGNQGGTVRKMIKGSDGEGESQMTGHKGKVFYFKQKETEAEIFSKSEQRKKKNEMFRKKIAEKKKKKKKKQQTNASKSDDFLNAVFVGGAE